MIHSIDNKFKKLIAYTSIVIFLGLFLTWVSVFFYKLVNDQWHDYLDEATTVYSLHDRLVQQLGYGGFIHNLKNLVLRKNPGRYQKKVEESLTEIKSILAQLRNYKQYNDKSLDDLEKVVQEYENNFYVALDLIAKHKTSEEIDAVVKVDDTPALAALVKFDSQARSRLKQASDEVNEYFRLAFVVHLLSVGLFILILGVYFFKLVRAKKKEFKLLERALEGSKAKSNFLANMSHEIRTPLNGIMGSLQVLQDNLKIEQNKKITSKALFSCRFLLSIINDILDFSKIEAQKLTIENVEFTFDTIADAVYDDMSAVAQSKSIFLKIDISQNAKAVWLGDPIRIRQVVLNLTSNAVKFTSSGGVHVKINSVQDEEEQGVEIKVIDSGIGMSKTALNTLFKRFTQADNSITRKFGGTGLGMAITQNLVDLMKGTISAHSIEGEGTTVQVFLPLKKSETPKPKENNSNCLVPDLSGHTILVAEDNSVNTMVIKAMLLGTKAELIFVENGQDAVDSFRQSKPDLILMDIQMPIMDGIQACKRIRETSVAQPVIALTANVMKDDIKSYQETGFDDVVGKPIEQSQLYKALSTYRSKHK